MLDGKIEEREREGNDERNDRRLIPRFVVWQSSSVTREWSSMPLIRGRAIASLLETRGIRETVTRERESSFKLHSAQFNYTASVSPRLSRRRRNALALLLALVQTQWPVKSHLHRDTNAIVHAGVNKLKETEASIQMERYEQLLWGTSTSRR